MKAKQETAYGATTSEFNILLHKGANLKQIDKNRLDNYIPIRHKMFQISIFGRPQNRRPISCADISLDTQSPRSYIHPITPAQNEFLLVKGFVFISV